MKKLIGIVALSLIVGIGVCVLSTSYPKVTNTIGKKTKSVCSYVMKTVQTSSNKVQKEKVL